MFIIGIRVCINQRATISQLVISEKILMEDSGFVLFVLSLTIFGLALSNPLSQVKIIGKSCWRAGLSGSCES